jgi:hypothetical protein
MKGKPRISLAMKKPGKVDKLEDSFFRTVRVDDPDRVRRFTNSLWT